MDRAMGGLGGNGPPKIYFFLKNIIIYIYMGRGVQRVEDLINPPNPIDLRPSGWTRSPLRVGLGFISNKT